MPRRVLQGTVVSDKMDKTVTVLVERRVMHQKYHKYVKTSAKYAAHDEANVCQIGDTVSIEECRPISRSKTWTVVEGKASNGTVREIVAFDAKAPAQASAPAKKAAKAEAKPAAKKEAAPKKAAAKKETAKASKEA